MYARLNDITPTPEMPYNGDQLGRDKSGEVLKQMVSAFPDGCVIALHGKWGSGKTTFINMWSMYMRNQKYTVLNYNAWKADYIPDPVIGLIAEFKNATDSRGKNTIEKMTKAAAKISFAMIPEIIAQIAKYYTGVDWEKIVKDGSKESMKILNQCIENYEKQQKSIGDFREALKEYIASLESDKPVIYIIDELDRCNPTFAVKTLERIKHLFCVPNIVFLLSIDREQLCNSIRGYYGSNLIDGDDYLRRFIDIQYDLPLGNLDNLIKSVLQRFDYTNEMFKRKNSEFTMDDFARFVSLLYQIRRLSIRQMEKWLLYTRLIIKRTNNMTIAPGTILFLIFIRMFDTEFYVRYKLGDIDDQYIIDYFVEHFSEALFDTGGYHAYYTYDAIGQLMRLRYSHNDIAFAERILDEEDIFHIKLNKIINEDWLRDTLKKADNLPKLLDIIHIIEMTDYIHINDE
jgi:energy-coupling factor transporter ATP-binding protein EcfA2